VVSTEPGVGPPLSFGLLGPLVVEVGGRPVELTGSRTKAVLAILLAHANSVVSADRLIDDLWAGQPTPGAPVTLQGYVSDLRRALTDALGEPAPVVTRRPGYLVRITPEQLDVLRFERLIAEVKAMGRDQVGHGHAGVGQMAERADLLRQALALWRGPALCDFEGEDFARPIAARLEEARMWALEERIEAELGTGCHSELVTELSALTQEYPLHEPFWGQLMLALYRCGRQAEALRTYQTLRRHLGDELALDPSPALQRLERAILTQHPSLELVLEPGAGREQASPPAALPPTARAASPHFNLPVNLTRFVGRGRELDDTRKLLSGTRLLTLAGSSGSGKTRLAVELVAGEADQWRDGVYFVDLSALYKPELVPAAVASAMGLSESGVDVQSVCEHIGDSHTLLLLDNCEHLVDACAELVEAVLSMCPGTTVLATSQEELRIASETVWRIPPLSLPIHTQTPLPERLLGSEAVQLFLDRAASLGDFAREASTLEAVAHICRRLDGIPLAIELAASLVAILPLEEIVRRLDDRLDLLTRGQRRAVSRHRTLRAAINWSYELLSPSERGLFERLSVFVGQFSVEAAEATGGEGEFLDDLSALVSKSMVVTVPGPGGTRRYQLLDSLRLYGLEKLRETGKEHDARRRHAAYYMSFAVEADRRLHGPEGADLSMRVIKELPNIRAALEWSFSEGDLEVGAQLAGALRSWFFGRMGQLAQTREWLNGALAAGSELSIPLRLKVLTAASTVASSQGDFRWGAVVGEEAVALAEELGDPYELAFAIMALGGAALFAGDTERAVGLFERSLAHCEEIGDSWTKASVLTFWGIASRRSGDGQLARRQLAEALAIFRLLRDEYGQILPLVQLAFVAQQLGDLDEAWRFCEEGMALARRLGDLQFLHGALCVGGLLQLARGHLGGARDLLLDSLRTGRGQEHHLFVALAIEGFAELAHLDGRDADAARLWGFSDELRSSRAIPLSGDRLAEKERMLAEARERSGDAVVAEGMAAGRRLTYPQVLDEVRSYPG
jgi:predicted ATPase/DNA-binding SARP family transcriptional activator